MARKARSLRIGVLLVALAAIEPGSVLREGRRHGRPDPRPDRNAPPFAAAFPPEPLGGGPASWRIWKVTHALRAADQADDDGSLAWREVGPSNIAGRVAAVAFRDPAKPTSLVAGAAGGGILATDDLGNTWRRLGGDDLPSLWIGAIAVDPANPDVFYAGTGDGNVTSAGIGGAGGILKTTDGGQTFRLLSLPESGAFYRIVVSASNRSVLLAAANDGLYRSGDAGETWEKTGGPITPLDIVQDPKNPLRFLAVSGKIFGGNGGLFESLDEGRNWNPIGLGLPAADAWGRGALTMTDLPVRSLYLWIDKTSDVGKPQLYRSLDDGANWEPITESGANITHGNGGYGAHLRVLGTPAGQTLVHHDGFLMYVARENGPISSTTSWSISSGQWHVDAHGADASPGDPGLWAAATDGGVAFSSDGALTFHRADQGFPTVQFYSCAIAPGARGTIYGGTQDNAMAIYRGDPGGAFESSGPPKLGDVGGISVNPANPSEVVAATSHAISVAVSTDSGHTWEETTGNGIPAQDFVTTSRTAVARSALDPNRVFLGTHRLNVSDDGGRHWTSHAVRPDPVGGIAALAVSPVNEDVWTLWNDGKVFVSSDVGITWADRSPLHEKKLGTVIAAGPADGSAFAAFAAGSGPRLFRTRDQGISWTDISADLPNGAVHALFADPGVPGRLIAGGDHGATISDDDGDHWRPLGVGLPNTIVMDLCVDPTSRRLVAATFGRGMWEIPPAPVVRRVVPVIPPGPDPATRR